MPWHRFVLRTFRYWKKVPSMWVSNLVLIMGKRLPVHGLSWRKVWKARQASLSMEFSRQEYWSGLPFPSAGDLPNPGIEPRSPTLQADSLPSEPPGMSLGSYWASVIMWLSITFYPFSFFAWWVGIYHCKRGAMSVFNGSFVMQRRALAFHQILMLFLFHLV